MSGFRVNPADLVVHANQVDELVDGLTLAQRAGAVVRTDAGSYGQLCQFVPALVDVLPSQVIDGVATAAGSVRDTADALRSVAAAYHISDSNAAERIRNTR